MSTPISWPPIGGAPYNIPAAGEVGWPSLSNFLIALQNAQGTQAQKIGQRIATTTPVNVISATDCIIIIRLTVPAPVTVNLPAGVGGQYFSILDGTGDASTNNITVFPNGAETINGAASATLNLDRNGFVLIFSPGSPGNWSIISSFNTIPSNIPRTNLAAGTPDYVVINAATGLLSEEQYLSPLRGGMGTNAGGFNGTVKASSGSFTASLIVDADISAFAAISDTKLATIATAGKVSNSATTAVSTATPNAIVTRDGSANFQTNDMTVFGGTANAFAVGRAVLENSTTGVSSFAGMTGIGLTTFTIGAGRGVIVDAALQTFRDVTWSTFSSQAPAAATGVSYVYIQSNGTPLITTTAPTPVSIRNAILLGRVITSAGLIQGITSQVVPVSYPNNLVYDFAQAIGVFQKDVITISANGANLSLNKTSGTVFQIGTHFVTDPKDPSYVPITGGSAISLLRATQSAPVGTFTTIDPTNYDNAGVVTVVPANNNATIQRVFQFASGIVFVQYGQVVYADFATALQAVTTESFVAHPSIAGNAVLIASIVVTKVSTDLTNTTNSRIVIASRFGDAGAGASGSSTSTLQNVYNNSVTPEIVTDNTRVALTVKRGSSLDTDNVYEGQNGAGTVTFSVNGNGKLTALSYANHFSATWAAADGTTKVVTHNLSSFDLIVQVYDIANGETIIVDTTSRSSSNQVTLMASEVPNVSGWKVLIIRIQP